jgi:hypothetical protein
MATLTDFAKIKLEEFADKTIAEIQENIKTKPVYKGKPANASGKTAASLKRDWVGDTLVISGAGHIFALEFGRKPTMNSSKGGGETLREKIRIWMDDKPVATSETAKKRNSIAWLITRGIHKRGTLLFQSGNPSGTLQSAISEEKIVKLGKEMLELFSVNAISVLLNTVKG